MNSRPRSPAARPPEPGAAAGLRLQLGIAALAALAWSGAWAGSAKPAFAVEKAAAGVYVHYGQQEEMTPANAGDVANMGFVVGERCVAVIDTGGTRAVGRMLRAAIREVTPLPVCYVINTHVHPDHVFGNAAFLDDHPEYVGHAHLAEAMRRRGPTYLRAVLRDVGSPAEGTTLVLPTRSVADTMRLDLGGRVLDLRAWPTAHTDTDLTVFDEASGVLWLGDLLFVGHIPVVDGSLQGFIGVISELKSIPARQAIPGHGRTDGWLGALAAEAGYLERLRTDVRAALAAKKSLAEAVDSIGYDASEAWLLADRFHRRNVTAAYAELEWAQ
ncbi:MAG TPA: quinoprotein relay system zinc metallohydrolase 2 [Casimicrobiaceae bacterium]|nr:quinoprotein relay system zinc metallohydrolase 2 [Casimicrobiaceae bacterium]